MSEKRKSKLLVAGLCVVCILLAGGIFWGLHRNGEKEEAVELAEETESIPLVVETVEETESITVKESETEIEKMSETESEAMAETETETVEESSVTVQKLQETPVKPETPKAEEKPQNVENPQHSVPEETVSQESQPAEEIPPVNDNSAPKTGDIKDGMMYIEGFGWVVYEGEGSGTYAGEIYENGNKIGSMD